MSIELKKANEYEKTEQEKIPVEEKPKRRKKNTKTTS